MLWFHQQSRENRIQFCKQTHDPTFGVEGDEAVAQRPVVDGLVENHVLGEDHHSDVLELTEPLQDLSHRLRLGLLRHGTDPHHDLSLRGLRGEKKKKKDHGSVPKSNPNQEELNINQPHSKLLPITPATHTDYLPHVSLPLQPPSYLPHSNSVL